MEVGLLRIYIGIQVGLLRIYRDTGRVAMDIKGYR